MSTPMKNVWREDAIEVLGSYSPEQEELETSFTSPRGTEPLLGTDWVQRPPPKVVPRGSSSRPNSARARGGAVVSPTPSETSSPKEAFSPVTSPRDSPLRRQVLSEKLQQAFSPSHYAKEVSPSRKQIISPRMREAFSPKQGSPVHHVFAEVHISPSETPSRSKPESTIIEMEEVPSIPSESTKEPEAIRIKPRRFTKRDLEVAGPSSPQRRPQEEEEDPTEVVVAAPAEPPFVKEEMQLSAKERRRKKKKKEKKPSASVNLEPIDPEEFFTRSWTDENTTSDPSVAPPDKNPPGSSPTPTEGSDAGTVQPESPDMARFTLEEYFGPSLQQLTEYKDPEKLPRHPKPGILFFPSNKPVRMEDKLGPGKSPRFLEAEGIYVGVKPDMSWSMRNKLERRILKAKSSSKRWFGEDGELISVEDAVRYVPLRSRVPDDLESDSLTIYRDAEIGECGTETSDCPLLLEVLITRLWFSHHHLMSTEQLKGQQLTELFKCYQRRRSEARTERLRGRLGALRHSRDLLSEQGDDGRKERIERVLKEIREVRNAMLKEGAHDRSLMAALLNTWRELRELRHEQGHVSSSLRLRVCREARAGKEKSERNLVEHEQAEWGAEINTMVAEMIEEQAAAMNDLEEETEVRTEDELRKLASEQLAESRRPPGEPKITFELTSDLEIDLSPSSSKERQRRLQLTKYRLCLRVLYNGAEVCRSLQCHLDDQFTAQLSLNLPLSVCQWPQSLSVELREEGKVTNNLLAEIVLPLPNKSVKVRNAPEEVIEFSGPRQGGCVHSPCVLHPSGWLACRVGWGVDSDGTLLQPPDKFWAAKARRGTSQKPVKTVEQLRVWVEKANLDPNDPNNAAIFNQIKGCEVESEEGVAGALTSELEIPGVDLAADTRLRILELRARGEPEFCNLKMVPPLERELPPGILKEFEDRRLRGPGDVAESEELQSAGDLLGQRTWGRKRLRQIRERVQLQGRLASRRRQLRDLVTEDLVPDIGTLGLTFVQWLQPSRPLRPARRPRLHQLASLPGLAKDAVLIVNVVSAFQVPVRRELDITVTGRSSVGSSVGSPPGFSTVAVRPFVEVQLQGENARTNPADGANPTWNQELQLPIKAGCEPRENVVLTLFDEVTQDVLEDERLRGVDSHTRSERVFLGSLTFPLAALHLHSRIDGTFPLLSPPLLGYERETPLRQFSGMSPNPGGLESPASPNRFGGGDESATATFLTVFVTVQPALQRPEIAQERLESIESPNVEQQLETWQAEISATFPERRVTALVATHDGRSACITRFIRPLPPPPDDSSEDNVRNGRTNLSRLPSDLAARFVSLIPAIDPGNNHPIWMPADQMLSLFGGEAGSRAALLVCYLQQLGLRAWLLLGWGLACGPGAFVLSRGVSQGQGQQDETDLWLWEVSSGKRTRLDDPFCPVAHIWALVNQDNVWANIQKETCPRSIRFDVARASDWLPAFPLAGPVAAPEPITCSVQPAVLGYTRTPQHSCHELAEKLERSLKDAFMSWRPSLRTRWNRHCSAVLRKALPLLENNPTARPEHMRELQPLLGAHKMLGFPLHQSLSDEVSVVRALHATQLHALRDPEVEFGIAVHVHPHPCRMVAIWVFAAALTRRR